MLEFEVENADTSLLAANTMVFTGFPPFFIIYKLRFFVRQSSVCVFKVNKITVEITEECGGFVPTCSS